MAAYSQRLPSSTASPNITATGRFCTRCGQHKPKDAFNANKRAPDGRASACRECVKADAALARAVDRTIRKYGQTVAKMPEHKPTTRVGKLDLPLPGDLPD